GRDWRRRRCRLGGVFIGRWSDRAGLERLRLGAIAQPQVELRVERDDRLFEFGGRLITGLGAFLERPQDKLIELWRERWIESRWRRRILVYLLASQRDVGVHIRVRRKRHSPRKHFVKRDAQAVDVRTRVEFGEAELLRAQDGFWRHISAGARRQLLCGSGAALLDFDDAEIADLDRFGVENEQVGRLDVAVNDADALF